LHKGNITIYDRYKEDLTPEQKEALVELSRVKSHEEISVEVRRELINSVCRGEMKPEPVDPVDVEMVMNA
jgi:essential nuclear protein 1